VTVVAEFKIFFHTVVAVVFLVKYFITYVIAYEPFHLGF
jgi:hypothetical protein